MKLTTNQQPGTAAANTRAITTRLRFSGRRALLCVAMGLLACTANVARGQAAYTAQRRGDLQVGGYFSYSFSPDYSPQHFSGGGGYATFDFRQHFGIEANFKEVVSPSADDISEKTYEIGGRYVRHYGRYHPYVRLSYGRGVFNFPYSRANLAYNLFSGAGGVDVNILKHVNVRGDFDYQRWLSFPPNGLSPSVVSVGAAYHF